MMYERQPLAGCTECVGHVAPAYLHQIKVAVSMSQMLLLKLHNHIIVAFIRILFP